MFRNFNSQSIFGKEYGSFFRPINNIIYQPYREMISCSGLVALNGHYNRGHVNQFYFWCLIEKQVMNALYFLFFINFFFTISVILRSPFRIIFEVAHMQVIFEILFLKNDIFILFHCFLFTAVFLVPKTIACHVLGS